MLTVSFKKKSAKVANIADAARVYAAARDKSGQGQRSWPTGIIADDAGVTVGYISYNGNVWANEPRDWKPGMDPMHRHDNMEGRRAA